MNPKKLLMNPKKPKITHLIVIIVIKYSKEIGICQGI